MDTAAQWPQEIGLVKPSMEVAVPSAAAAATCSARPQLMERRPRPQKEHALNCPRCQSTNTKFCYYNNYSLSQPRYFCKACRRYWTEGGSLRNVPVGGGSRKNKRPSAAMAVATNPTPSSTPTSSSSSATSAKKLSVDPSPTPISSVNNPKFHEGQDLNLAFPQNPLAAEFVHQFDSVQNSAPDPSTCSSARELLRGGIPGRGLSPLMPMVMTPEGAGVAYPPGFGLQDFRSSIAHFSVDGIGGGGGYEDVQGVQDGSGRVQFFPFGDLRQDSSPDAEMERARGQGGDPCLFWSGVMGGAGGSW